MTATLTLFWAASKALMQEAPAPQITNPLPVLKGQIGKIKPQASNPLDGYAPLDPARMPGVLFAMQSIAKEPVVQAPPMRQGPNSAFNSALDSLFKKGLQSAEIRSQLPAGSKTIARHSAKDPQPRPAPKSPPLKSQPPIASPSLPSASRTRPAPTASGSQDSPRQAQTASPKPPAPKAVPVGLPRLQSSPSSSSSPAGTAKRQDLGSRLISLDVVDLELTKVIQSLSDQTGVNLVLLGQTNKTMTLRLSKVTLESALSHICAVSGVRFLLVKGAYVVAQPEDLKQAYPSEYEAAYPSVVLPQTIPAGQGEPPTDPKLDTIEVISLAYVTASEVVNVLKTAFTEKELVSRAGPTQHVPSLSSAETSNVTGVSTGILRSDGQESGGAEASSSPGSRVVVVRGTKESVEAAKKLALQLDLPRPQVAIAVRILDISDEVMKDLGLSWTFGDQTFTERGGSGIGFRTFDRSAGAIMARLSALKKDDQAKILAEPNISVLDNQKAFILIGQRLNFPTLVGYTQANTPIFAPKEEKVGIYLQVNASVSPTDEITMSLYPQVSTVTSFLEVNGGSYPQIATREAQTTLRVRTGDTIILGGLIREEEIKNVQKVPLLSDIPILGEFFKKVKTQKTKSQIIITITPTITQPNAR